MWCKELRYCGSCKCWEKSTGNRHPKGQRRLRKIFMTTKSPTQWHMSPEANINFRVITDIGRVVYKYVYMLPCMSVPVFACSGIHLQESLEFNMAFAIWNVQHKELQWRHISWCHLISIRNLRPPEGGISLCHYLYKTGCCFGLFVWGCCFCC